ncbi:PHD-finger family protein [Aphelenchoides avenae]|nr:PHD-finger family protein [Aphelenchus avenae]
MASMAAAAGSKLPPTSMNLPAFNSNTLLELLSNSGGGLLPGLLPPPPQMPQLVSRNPGQFATGQFAPDLLALYQQQLNSGANMNLNNLLLPQTTQIPMPQVQSAPIPAPPPMRMNLSSMTEPLAPPPPPPPPMKLSKSKSGEGASNGRSSGRSSGSPMDIDLELDEATTSSKPSKGGTNGDKKERAAATNEAAKAMKAALRPHYSKGSVTKEEYKEIMKKGVSKLVKKLRAGKQLDQQKVDGFVRDYVNVFSTRRQLKNHKAQR